MAIRPEFVVIFVKKRVLQLFQNMKVLFLSNLYPNARETTRATFNRQKITALSKHCEITVIAPVPWFPFKSLLDKKSVTIPFTEKIDGIEVYHPKVFYFPKFFRFLYGFFYYKSISGFVKELHAKLNFDVIYCSWVYPDGYAAMELAKQFHKPFMVEALGSDIKVYAKNFLRRNLIAKVLKKAQGLSCVSNDLKNEMIKLSIPGEKIRVICSGINHSLFYPVERDLARRDLNIRYDGKIVLYAGNLVRIKGLEYLLQAVTFTDKIDYKLFIAGDGELRHFLEKQIQRLNLKDKVVLCGKVPYENISLWINASDILCLPSLSEGVANVILEALACGKPVIATLVGGAPEIINDEKLGILVEPKDSRALAKAINGALGKEWNAAAISKSMSSYSWELCADKLMQCLRDSCYS